MTKRESHSSLILKTIVSLTSLLILIVPSVAAAASSHGRESRVCSVPNLARASCSAHVVTDRRGSPAAATQPSGYGPAQLRGGYGLSTASSSATIAIVDAYNDPNIKADLDHYDSTYGLPAFASCSSTVTTSCFMKVNQRGGSSSPSTNSGWALEISLDVEVAHAVCPTCKLILVEADSSSYTNLMTAVDRARSLDASVISNSYGSSEFLGETAYDSYFNHPGVAFTFSTGDSGYGATYPAASPYVTAVGGTTLNLNPDNSWKSESIWSGAGSGCSAYESKPTFQTDKNCSKRSVADVSADADPNTGAAVYDSVRYSGLSGWFQVGGTSLASPLVAAVYALAGGVPASTQANTVPYANFNYSTNLHDITSGSNGSCGGTYLCTGSIGYDGPSGLGTPNGAGAF